MRSITIGVILCMASCGGEGVAPLPDGGMSSSPDGSLPGPGPDASFPGPDASAPDAAPAPTGLPRCVGRAFPPREPGGWRNPLSGIVAAFAPYHAADDALVAVEPGGTTQVTVGSKFQYSDVFKDLEDEIIEVWLDDCDGWQLLGERITDGDGRITFTFPPLAEGIYDVRYVVDGDATTTSAQLWILPRGTHLTVFDIDGTLTTSDFEVIKDLFVQILRGDYVPEAYPHAAEMTWAHRDARRVGVYLTGRPYWLRHVTREWLAGLGAAPGPLFLTRHTSEALPTVDGVGTFKKNFLVALVDAGFQLDSAQGNATTDIYAYLGAGIPPGSTFIIGDHAGEQGTVAVEGGWAEHVQRIAAAGPVEQPFEW